jgi:heme O synthase-like polyprenyltransferase
MTEIPAQNLPGQNPVEVQPKRRIADWKDYLDLMKPRVMSLVIFTAVVGYLCAPGDHNPILGALAIFAIAMGAGAAGALNMWYDADIDGLLRQSEARGESEDASRNHGANAVRFQSLHVPSTCFFHLRTWSPARWFLIIGGHVSAPSKRPPHVLTRIDRQFGAHHQREAGWKTD